jgi:hypothetical protein
MESQEARGEIYFSGFFVEYTCGFLQGEVTWPFPPDISFPSVAEPCTSPHICWAKVGYRRSCRSLRFIVLVISLFLACAFDEDEVGNCVHQ